ncbi:MAG: diheme cytochrome c [Hyphomicrobiaceae bacterium]|nr:diheme cytochrome c [Hyphomicrobiaceae bacterium]
MKKILIIATLIALQPGLALAGKNYGRINDEVVRNECGACHLAFQPRLLRSNSWEKIMAGLDDHFGEDASLDPEVTSYIADYFAKKSRKSSSRRRVTWENVPIRITKLRWFLKEHRGEVSRAAIKKAGTMANCGAGSGCHSAKDVARGYYDD